MAKVNLTPDEFADFVCMFMLDLMTDKNMTIRKANPKFAAVVDKLGSMGLRSVLTMYFFGVGAFVRQRYGQVRNIFSKKSSDQLTIYITQDSKYQEKLKDKQQIKQTVKTVLKLLNQGNDINSRQLNMLQEQVIRLMERDGEL